ncbi:unnamed protein product, partial [Porites evermanni]
LKKQETSKQVSLFDNSSTFVTQLLYISLGALSGLLLIGTIWDFFIRRKPKKDKDTSEVGRINGAFALSSGKETICRDVEAARILFRQMDEHLSKLETKVSMLL